MGFFGKAIAASGIMAMASFGHLAHAQIQSLDGSVELDSPLGLTASVALRQPLDPNSLNVILPGDFTFTVSYNRPTSGSNLPDISNVGLYATIEARPHGMSDRGSTRDGKKLTSQVFAAFGCGMWSNQNLSTAAPTGISCNNAPLSLSAYPGASFPIQIPAEYANSAKYDIVSRVSAVYNSSDGNAYRTSSRYVSVQMPGQTDSDCQSAAPNFPDDQKPCSHGELRGNRFDVMSEYAKNYAPSGTLFDVNSFIVWVRSAEAADNVEVIADLGYNINTDTPLPVVISYVATIGCAVGPMAPGQTLVYQGQSCNHALGPFPVAAGKQLYARYSVNYTGNHTCQSGWVPVVPLVSGGTTPDLPSPSGLTYDAFGNGHANNRCAKDLPAPKVASGKTVSGH